LKIVLNIGNRLEVARMSARAVDQLINELRQTPDLKVRGDMIVQSITRWQGLFPPTANREALAALNTSLKRTTASGSAGIEVLQCARVIEHMELAAEAEAKRKRTEAARARMAAARKPMAAARAG
jgi:hypothetical protein